VPERRHLDELARAQKGVIYGQIQMARRMQRFVVGENDMLSAEVLEMVELAAARSPEPSPRAEREDATGANAGGRWWFSFDGWHRGNLEEEFVLA
jgi:hypothetical protein